MCAFTTAESRANILDLYNTFQPCTPTAAAAAFRSKAMILLL